VQNASAPAEKTSPEGKVSPEGKTSLEEKAQQDVCPGQTGTAALQCVQANYSPTSTLGYDPARDVLYRDIDASASGELEGVYSGYAITLTPGEDPSKDAFSKDINAEHVFPQSKGAGSEPRKSDMHNLYPARSQVNSARSNIPFGESPDARTDTWYRKSQTQENVPSSNIDAYSERLGSSTWEPREAREGDIARAVFYFYAIYKPSADDAFFEGMKAQLLDWHQSDPPTQAEKERSAAIAAEQGNENPFVLDETLAGRVFGSSASGPTLVFDPSSESVAEDEGSAAVTVRYDNPSGASVDAEVVFDGGASTAQASDLGSYSTQSVSFPSSASDGATRSVTVPIADDSEAEGPEDAVFRLENVTTSDGTEVSAGGPLTLTIIDDDRALVINEVLADPPTGPAGDANGDGSRSATEDEFIEIYNAASAPVDISGYRYVDEGVGTRHVFPEGTQIPPQTTMVVFGGGSPASTIPGRVQVASTGTLALNNGGDSFRIETGGGSEVLSFSYDGSIDNQSLTRDPDFTGPFVAHSSATGSGGALFSPGRSVEGDPLPVELVSFEGRAQGEESVVLTWRTASETQNAGFEVERKTPGERWQPVEFVAGAGTDLSGRRYRFTDSDLPHEARELAYRLRQVDSDGTRSLSETIRVELPRATRLAVDNVYPNPASGPITVELSVPEGARGASLKLRDALGRTVQAIGLTPSSQGAFANQGASAKGTRRRIQVSTKGLAAGMYFLTVSGGASGDRSAGPAHKVVLLQ
jgi:hypothetical protein